MMENSVTSKMHLHSTTILDKSDETIEIPKSNVDVSFSKNEKNITTLNIYSDKDNGNSLNNEQLPMDLYSNDPIKNLEANCINENLNIMDPTKVAITNKTKDHNENENENESESDGDYDQLKDPNLRRDAADHIMGFFVYSALFFFTLLFATSILLSFLLISSFGILGILILCSLLILVFSIIYGIRKVINEEPKFKPIKYQLNRWKHIAKAVVEMELNAFKLDLREMYLITNEADDYFHHEEDMDNGATYNDPQMNKGFTNETQNQSKRHRSVILKIITAPFGGLKKMQKKFPNRKTKIFSKRKKASTLQEDSSSSLYIPPLV